MATSTTTSDNEWKWVRTNDSEWQRITRIDKICSSLNLFLKYNVFLKNAKYFMLNLRVRDQDLGQVYASTFHDYRRNSYGRSGFKKNLWSFSIFETYLRVISFYRIPESFFWIFVLPFWIVRWNTYTTYFQIWPIKCICSPFFNMSRLF